mmetsp:Transcript_12999/g.28112  ORF Transcript_12999/g.28112 Transcript_12999/m.28112 type:complete len:607 (-) Transcript_12999:27-1847(-)
MLDMYLSGLVFVFAVSVIAASTGSSSASEPPNDDSVGTRPRRIAIIGGGISGSFCAKYLVDYDERCLLDAVDIYEPSSMNMSAALKPGVPVTDAAGSATRQTWQGSRVSSITLSDGTIVELGASIIYDGNKLAVQMLEGDSTLSAGRPFYPGKEKAKSEEGRPIKSGFGIYNGNGEWLLNTAPMWSLARKVALLWRYNVDLFRISQAASSAITSFELIYELLESNQPATFLDSPDEIWESVGLKKLSLVTFDEFLDAIGVCREVEGWRSYIPYQGCIRTELLSAASINNYNQATNQMNGLSGLVSFIPTKGKLFGVEGGNYQLIGSALKQAQSTRSSECKEKGNKKNIKHVAKEVTTVIGDLETGMELFSGEESLGNYDVVILAAPLQHCGTDFFVKSHLDGAVLQPMPVSGMIDSDEADANTHQHITPSLPSSATRPYTQVTTSVVSNGNLQSSYFNLSASAVPRSIYVSEEAWQLENVFTVTHLTSDVFKVFSQTELPETTLNAMFGPNHVLEYVKLWGGKHGGATPDFNGGGESSTSTPFLLYDGAEKTTGHGFGPALFYVNSMEASVAAVEISAIGAKAVAKLCAKRLELIPPTETARGDEL